MANDEVNVIGHLLDVEKGASQLVSDAQLEASKRIASARASADSDYKTKYSAMVEELEKDSEKRILDTRNQYAESFETYKTNILKTKKDTVAFNSLLDSILFTA